MKYAHTEISDEQVPRAVCRTFQHAADTYASETNKVAAIWRQFPLSQIEFRPHAKCSTVIEIFKHQLLSERRFFAEFLGMPEPAAGDVLAGSVDVQQFCARLVELALPRLTLLAEASESWWLGEVPFFDVQRERCWIFWRRVLHTAHHRTQLTLYLRMLDLPVPSTYGPTADVTWSGADPTTSVEAAGRAKR